MATTASTFLHPNPNRQCKQKRAAVLITCVMCMKGKLAEAPALTLAPINYNFLTLAPINYNFLTLAPINYNFLTLAAINYNFLTLSPTVHLPLSLTLTPNQACGGRTSTQRKTLTFSPRTMGPPTATCKS